MYVIYWYFPSVPERDDEAEIIVSDSIDNNAPFYRSESLWIVPGTVDPRDD